MTNHPSKAQITSTATMQIGGELTATDLYEFVKSVPADAKVSIRVTPGDQRDPGSTTITATWTGGAPNTGFQLPQSNIPGAR